jgi:hypothetical protein
MIKKLVLDIYIIYEEMESAHNNVKLTVEISFSNKMFLYFFV